MSITRESGALEHSMRAQLVLATHTRVFTILCYGYVLFTQRVWLTYHQAHAVRGDSTEAVELLRTIADKGLEVHADTLDSLFERKLDRQDTGDLISFFDWGLPGVLTSYINVLLKRDLTSEAVQVKQGCHGQRLTWFVVCYWPAWYYVSCCSQAIEAIGKRWRPRQCRTHHSMA